MKKIICVLFLVLPLASLGAESDYTSFSAFRDTAWGAEQDSLYYVFFGETMSFDSGGDWTHISENSATIGFETSLPSTAWIHYGTAADTTGWAAADTTDHGDGRYFNHLRYITGLTADTQYWYHLVAVDERGNLLNSETRTFTTEATGGVTYIDSGDSFPVSLSSGTYRLSEDIRANQRAFTVSGNNVILDLNGFTVTYDDSSSCLPEAKNSPDDTEGSTWDDFVGSSCATFGIRVNNGIYGFRVYGGTIAQGDSLNHGDYDIGYGFNPIFSEAGSTAQSVIAGVTVEYGGDFLTGIEIRSGKFKIHHNVIRDYGTLVGNRDQGRKAINGGAWGVVSAYNNLIKRARQQCIAYVDTCYDNEIYSDSWSTNSFGVKPNENVRVVGNKIFGTGYHSVALAWSTTSCDSAVYRNNFVHMRGVERTQRDSEYGTTSSVVGFRHTQYTYDSIEYNNFLVAGNTIIIEAQENCEDARGMQITSDRLVSNFIVRNNVVKNTSLDSETTTPNACVFLMGREEDWHRALPVVFEDNTFIANETLVCANDDYQVGGNFQFRNCTFIKEGSRASFETIDIGYYTYDSYDNRFIDCTFSGGADIETNPGVGGATYQEALLGYDWGIGQWLTATTDGSTPYATTDTIKIFDLTGESYMDTIGASGLVRVELLEGGWYSDGSTTGLTAVDHGSVASGDYMIVAYNAGSADTVTVTSEIWDATTSESVPLTINFSSGGTVPGFTFDGASVTDNVLTIGWTDASSTEWQVQATINGTTSYTILVDSASASFPVAAGTIDIKVTGDASGFTQGQASN